MRKVWITSRKGIPGMFVEWYDDLHRRRSKYFSPKYKNYVKLFQARKFTELNSDIRPIGEVVDISWLALTEQYLYEKKVEGLAPSSIVDLKLTFDTFKAACKPSKSKHINRAMVLQFVTSLRESTGQRTGKPISPHTINKHLRNIRALFAWGAKYHYLPADIEIKSVKAILKPPKALKSAEIRELLIACGDDWEWRIRILLVLTTPLRIGDIDSLDICDINIENKTITKLHRKTGKTTLFQPLPDALMPELIKYLTDYVSVGQARLFKHKFSKKWYRLQKRAGLAGIKITDLRRTFGSMQIAAGVSLKTVQEQYQHSTIETTAKHYITTDDEQKRKAVNSLPVKDWL